jgi:hypothetical protein
MSWIFRNRLLLPLLTISSVLTGCSSSPPSSPTIRPADVSGTWAGEETFTSITGGECLGPALQDAIGLPSQFKATLTQSGNKVAGVLDINHTGGVCDYEGTINGNALVIMSVRCRETRADGITCSADAMRDLVLRTESLQATVNGDRILGTAAETDDVFVSGTTISLNPLVTVSSFVLTRN